MSAMRSVSAAALSLLFISGAATAAQVQVTITGTLSAGTDHYSNTWPNVETTMGGASSIAGQAFTARIVYETNALTPARNAYEATPSWGDYWDNTSNGGNSQVYQSFIVSSDITIYGQTIAMDTSWSSQLEANDTAASDRFILTGGDLHAPAGDTVDNEFISLNINKAGLFPVPFVASEAPVNPLALVLSATGGSAWLEFKLYDYQTSQINCKTLDTYPFSGGSVPATRNCPGDRFTGNVTHWVDGYGNVSSVSIASVVPIPATAWLLGSALVAMGGVARRKLAR